MRRQLSLDPLSARAERCVTERGARTGLPYVCPKLQHFTVNMYYIFAFNLSQIQDARNWSMQSVYVFCSNRMMRKFALYKRTCCCKLMVEEFSHLVCYKEMPFQNGRQISE